MSFLCPLEKIIVGVGRQRRLVEDIESLASSFTLIGQLAPIVVQPDEVELGHFLLVAGERRLRAARYLKWPHIEATLREDLDEATRTLIELEENIRRKQLTWQEELLAVKRFAEISGEENEALARDLCIPPSVIGRMLLVAEALPLQPRLAEQSSWTAAHTLLVNTNRRKADAAIETLLVGEDVSFPLEALDLRKGEELPHLSDETKEKGKAASLANESSAKPLPRIIAASPHEAICIDFLQWQPSGKRFNFIHLDPPYGLNMDKANLQNSSSRWNEGDTRYEDSPEVFDAIMRSFFDRQELFVAESAHCICWTAHKNYGKLASRFAYYGWSVCEVPLIWHKSDNAGIAPDTNRWPRRTYEIAVFASRGDRKILRVKAASIAAPTTKEGHLSEKPLAVLDHFFEMLVDEHTEMLDPTCGGGTALEVAKKRGAARALGLDIEQAYVDISNRRLR